MLIIPAIDLKDGCVVRFVQGKLDKKVYSKDPVKTAKHWVRQGAKMIHVVDLDGASTGEQKNLAIVEKIVKSVKVPIQFGGGVRNFETLKKLFQLGVTRVVLGTKAFEDKNFLIKAFREFRERLIVSIDAKAGKILIKGWEMSFADSDVISFARTLKVIGFKQLIYTDVSKDGTLKGPDIKGLKQLLREAKLSVIASGGVSSLDDIRKLKALEKEGVVGVIIGKALYEGKFTLQQAIKSS